jgi:DtxR family Mn-dependent transcriptional regulator
MLKKLAGDGYVDHRARGDARLTAKGLEVAVRVMRRHRLAECFLTEMLGLGWDEVAAEACRLEHAISARVEERLIAVLGDPRVCPHGHPIPPADGSDPPRPGIPLAEIADGATAVVHRVSERGPERLRYLAEIGLRPGARVQVVEKAPLGGPLTIVVGASRCAISLELAQMVAVLPAG